MNPLPEPAGFTPERAHFGGEVSPAIARLLNDASAAHATPARAEAALWSAYLLNRDCLPVYFALYKFYFYRGQLDTAEDVVRKALVAAARLAGFDPNWETATAQTTDWTDRLAPQHFWLFSLKALAFIRLRARDLEESARLIERLQELDPQDSVGWSVIKAYLDGARRTP